MVDRLGQPVTVGDTVCYPGRKRSRLWLSTLKVLCIDGDKITGLNQHGRGVTIRRENGSDLVVAKGGAL